MVEVKQVAKVVEKNSRIKGRRVKSFSTIFIFFKMEIEATNCLFCNKNGEQLVHLKTRVSQFESDLAAIACEVLCFPVTILFTFK